MNRSELKRHERIRRAANGEPEMTLVGRFFDHLLATGISVLAGVMYLAFAVFLYGAFVAWFPLVNKDGSPILPSIPEILHMIFA
jgi:hypothetical protein